MSSHSTVGNAGAAQEAVTLFQTGQEQKETMKGTANNCIVMLNTYVQGANTKFLVSLGIQFPGGFLTLWLIGPRISPVIWYGAKSLEHCKFSLAVLVEKYDKFFLDKCPLASFPWQVSLFKN